MSELLQHRIQDGEGQAALVLVENASTDCFACARVVVVALGVPESWVSWRVP